MGQKLSFCFEDMLAEAIGDVEENKKENWLFRFLFGSRLRKAAEFWLSAAYSSGVNPCKLTEYEWRLER